jgi:hypothetical protein
LSDDDYFQDGEVSNNVPLSLIQARKWYNEQMQGQEVFVGTTQGEGKQLFFTEPSWTFIKESTKDNLSFVEVDLTDRIALDFVPADNADAYEKTGEFKYIHSVTRLVIQTDKNTAERIGFLMTIIPSVWYSANLSKRTATNTYLTRDESLDGLIVYHNLSGEFVNGWQYKEGKIVASLRETTEDDATVSYRAIPATYEVRKKIATRSNDEYYTIPEVEIWGYYSNYSYSTAYYVNYLNSYLDEINSESSGSSNNGSSSSSDDSGGGYYSPPTPPTPPTPTPCDKLNSVVEKYGFTSLMTKIRDKNKASDMEYGGYFIKLTDDETIQGRELEPASVTNGNAYLGMPSFPIDGYIHTHPEWKNSIFSVDDLYTLYLIDQKGRIKDKSTFIFALISGDNTTYILKIEDNAKWSEFSNYSFKYKSSSSLEKLFDDWNTSYSLMHGSEIASNEKRFLEFLSDMDAGLKLYRGDVTNFSTWERLLGLDNNSNIIKDDCK